MVGGLLAAASLVCVGSAVLRQRSRVAAAWFAAALAAAAADAFGAGPALHDVAQAVYDWATYYQQTDQNLA